MISVKTYIKKNNEFVELHEYKDSIDDLNYIEGALELTINGVALIDKNMWDYIDQLWFYISDGIGCLLDNQSFETYFPDQPIKMKMTPFRNNVIFSVTCNSEEKILINKADFISVMTENALDFFDFLRKKDCSFNDNYQEILTKLRR